jgi:hypothetical protein
LGLDVVFSIILGVHELKFCRKADVGFVEWNEKEREDLVDIDEQEGRLLIEFYNCQRLDMSSPEAGWRKLAVTFDVQDNSWRQDFVPPIDHPDDPSRVDFADQWQRYVGETGYPT